MSARGDFAAAIPSIAELLREVPAIRRVLFRCGIRPADRADLIQEVLLGAWVRIAEGEFRPDPQAAPGVALRGWLCRIAYNKADHWRKKAWSRRIALVGLDLAGASPEYATHPIAYLEARDELASVRHLYCEDRKALLARAAGATFEEISASLGIPLALAVHWTNTGRERLAELLGREGKR
ncbi:RNA polymerase sigma factor [Chondromyces apiculatus]|uniref:RNA polymerase sigma-70 region 2 domain-containing protein n=1 Tax=Chondromyces apiculatus DSM 436 TaxID=1192034 RepID=A0A017TBU6_9BACT|nr:sigma factor [Chondromyces apiculatus]EYF06046.1 Hypothetical protein CAP_2236 [Chondromyces apiculatus DSM 436]